MAMAEPERRVILITGDGAHQMTINALADMAITTPNRSSSS